MHKALHHIWTDFHKELEGFVYSRVKDKDITKDILQDVFIKIFQNLENLKDQSKLSSWIYQITRNVVNDHFRKQKPTSELEDSIFIDDASTNEFEQELQLSKCIEPFVDQLESKYKEAIILTEFKGLTQKELAEHLNISYSGAKSRVQRAKQHLKSLFTDCCKIQSDQYGNIMDYEQKKNCTNCCN